MIEAPNFAKNEYQEIGKTETATPFFTTDKYFPFFQQTEAQFEPNKAETIIKQRLAKDIESQMWELREGELPYEYVIHLMDVLGESRMVHESNLETKTDLVQGVSEKIRKGAEKCQIIEAKKRAINAKVGTTFFIPSPKHYERDESYNEAPYVDSILTVMYKLNQDTISCRQYLIKQDTPNFTAPEMADLINKLNGKNIIDRNSNISQILMAIGEVEQMVTNSQIWQAIEQITGCSFLSKSVEQLSKEEVTFEKFSKEGSEYIYNLLKSGISKSQLQFYYSKMMGTYLKNVNSGKISHDDNGGIYFDTSCGSFGSFGFGSIINGVWPEEKKPDMWCTICKEKKMCNYAGDICYKPSCRGKLSILKPVYDNFT